MAKKKPIGIADLQKKKAEGKKITMLTAYDYPGAQLVDEAGIDTVLVGDSLANVVLGYRDTVPVTMDEMLHHVKAVRRGVQHALLIADMPFGSYNAGIGDAIKNATRFMKEAGADAVKLEGGGPMIDVVRAMVEAGIPVVGHLGLTPQTVGLLGGYRVQGNTADKAIVIYENARGLANAGAFLLVLEMVPHELAREITQGIAVPTIGIGAGAECDGQVLVFHDMLGIRSGFTPRFVKRFAEVEREMRRALVEYRGEVESGAFPADEHTFHMSDDDRERLLRQIADLSDAP
ncbi:3-methyl-2-oxobutanoate hydroxymethyltransferase [bacterium]|nr:3-methyl-2-oxobutanoate hydroxymethyltransferase [bacterium]